MKKIILLLCFSLMLTACTANDNSDTEQKSTETVEITETTTTAETTITTAAPAKTKKIHTTVTTALPAQLPTEPIKADSWQRGYVKYLNRFWGNRAPYQESSYDLIYLDDNDIPELFVDTGVEASGEYIVTFFDGEIHEHHLSRIGTDYIEKSGLLFTDTGHQGVYPVKITELKNGNFDVIASGSHNFKADDKKDTLYFALDENGYPIIEYKWEDNIVSESEFYESIDSVFDREQGKRPERYSFNEMLSVLYTGQCSSYGHTYELIQADVSWEEAQKLCHDKGGYLATITSPDEQKTIVSKINEEGMQDISFYVGYRDCEKIDGKLIDRRWINANGSFNFNVKISTYYSSPDYKTGKEYEWDYADQNCGLIKYYTSTDQIYLFDAPENLTEVSPEYSGKMGYICEYDN